MIYRENTGVENKLPTVIHLSRPDKGLLLLLSFLTLGLMVVEIRREVPVVRNTINVPAPPDPIDMSARGEFDSDTGAFVPYPVGTTATVMAFDRDCRDVCESPAEYRSSREPVGRPGRVLYSDPEHLICACFRPDHLFGDGVDRYVGWRHVVR